MWQRVIKDEVVLAVAVVAVLGLVWAGRAGVSAAFDAGAVSTASLNFNIRDYTDLTESVNAIANERRQERVSSTINQWLATDNVSSAEFGIYLKELSQTGLSYKHNPRQKFVAASTYKLFLTYHTLSLVERGELSMDKIIYDGQSVESCIAELLVNSSNDCAYNLGRAVSWTKLDKRLVDEGYLDTKLNNYTASGAINGDKMTSARDLGQFLERLYSGSLLNEMHTNLIINHLKNQVWRERIPAGLPPAIEVADKPGFLESYQHDAAIVFGPLSTYILVVMSHNSDTGTLSDLSALIYRELQVTSR